MTPNDSERQDEERDLDEEKWEKLFDLGTYFLPSAPVSDRDLFAGRSDQLEKLLEVISEQGRHAVVYGERGVGKTSMARVLGQIIRSSRITTHDNCSTTDSFADVWRRVLRGVQFTGDERPAGLVGTRPGETFSADALLPADPTPHDVVRVIEAVSTGASPVFVIDEFDRINDQQVIEATADVMKGVSDYGLRATIIIVGVADSVPDLIAGHQSIERSLVQISMPRMSVRELSEIVRRGMAAAEMTIGEEEMVRIATLSRGLPHYTHLLALNAARNAVEADRTEVLRTDVDAALARAVHDAEASILHAYELATASTRETNYPEVLLACALARSSDLGFFAPADVREPLSLIMGRPYDIPQFQSNLAGLTSDERGPALDKIGRPRNFRYRFSNPLLQPYVVIRGLRDGLITEESLTTVVGAG